MRTTTKVFIVCCMASFTPAIGFAQTQNVESKKIQTVQETKRQEQAEKESVWEKISTADSCKKFAAAIKAAGMDEMLGGDGEFTLFIPNDEVFEKMKEGEFEAMLAEENREKLVQLLKNHIIEERISFNDLAKKTSLQTSAETDLTVSIENNKLVIGNAKIRKADIACSNGVIHMIDNVNSTGK